MKACDFKPEMLKRYIDIYTKFCMGCTHFHWILYSHNQGIPTKKAVPSIILSCKSLLISSHIDGGENWLCGDRFSIADVYLSVLLHRLVFVGLAEQLFLSKRPLLRNYYQRVLERPSFKEKCLHVNEGKYWTPSD